MPEQIDPKAFLHLCDLSIDNMYELEALGELLEQRGLLTKKEIIDRVKSLKEQVQLNDPIFPEAHSIPEKENAVIEQIMEVICMQTFPPNKPKPSSSGPSLLQEWGERTAPKSTH